MRNSDFDAIIDFKSGILKSHYGMVFCVCL